MSSRVCLVWCLGGCCPGWDPLGVCGDGPGGVFLGTIWIGSLRIQRQGMEMINHFMKGFQVKKQQKVSKLNNCIPVY